MKEGRGYYSEGIEAKVVQGQGSTAEGTKSTV
jgi:hypothetical protein